MPNQPQEAPIVTDAGQPPNRDTAPPLPNTDFYEEFEIDFVKAEVPPQAYRH